MATEDIQKIQSIRPIMNKSLVKEWERVLTGEGIILTTEGLINALGSRHLYLRLGSAIILGRRGEVSVIPYLKPLLEDHPMVCVEAAMSLYLLGDRSGMPVLIKTMDGDLLTGAPLTSAKYLALSGDPRGYTIVLRALRSDLDGTRLSAATALKSFIPFQGNKISGKKVDLFDVVRKTYKDSNPLVRRELLYILSKLNKQTSSALLSAISRSDKDQDIRRRAHRYLSSLPAGSIS
jgi:HEAT repeat protein